MKYRYLGKSGLQVSALSFGAWVTFGDQVNEQRAADCMVAAYENGVNFFDNAEAYSGGMAETMMGNILQRMGWRRSDLVISTKLFWGNDCGLSRKHILEGMKASLERLQMDYVDLVFCHRPDLHTPVEETVRAMSYLVDSGQAHYWGTSEWSAERIMQAWQIARREHLVPPVMEQPQYNMFWRDRVEREYAPLYQEPGLGTTVWSPLASGMLAGKYLDGIPDDTRVSLEKYQWLRERFEDDEGHRRIAVVRELVPIAEELGLSLARLALAWCLENENVSSVITGASRPEQVVENMKAVDDVERLTPPVMERIDAVLGNRPQPPVDWREN